MNPGTDSIFVQIPAYRDSQLIPTLEDMFANASNVGRLNIVVCWQHAEKEKIPRRISSKVNVNFIPVDYRISKGANWARRLIQKQWKGEPYSFLMDSHLRFVRGWDHKLISMLESTRGASPKPIISGFPPSFEDPNLFPAKRLNHPVITYPKDYESNLLTRFYAEPIAHFKWLQAPVPASFLAMGFLFTDGIFNVEIPFDPKIYFFGDDITTGLRAFCHGYDFYHPHRIIAWHLYNRATRVPHWHDHENWTGLEQRSIRRITSVLSGRNYKHFPLGTVRSVRDYERHIGRKLIFKAC